MTIWIRRRWPRAVALLVVPALMAAACSGGGDDSHPTASSALAIWAEAMCSLVNDATEREIELVADARQMFTELESDADTIRFAVTFAQKVSNSKRDAATELDKLHVPVAARELHTEIQTTIAVQAIQFGRLARELERSISEADFVQELSNFIAQTEIQAIPQLSGSSDDLRFALGASPACQEILEDDSVEISEV